MRVTGATRTFAVVGSPVAHSQSPSLHNGLFARHGVDAVYVALEVEPARAPSLVSALRVLPLAGVNLTVPFKQAVLAELDRVDGLAALLGAVNTVVREGDMLVGHNTDADGFVDGVRSEFGDVIAGRRAVVLGAGGAGLAVGAGLAAAGATDVTWLNRSVDRAEVAAMRCEAVFPRTRFHAGALDEAEFARHVRDAGLVVMATSGAGAAIVAGLDARAVPSDAVWVDLNYWMDAPPLWDALRARGVRLQGGRPMLAFQGARAFTLFTGISPDAGWLRAWIG